MTAYVGLANHEPGAQVTRTSFMEDRNRAHSDNANHWHRESKADDKPHLQVAALPSDRASAPRRNDARIAIAALAATPGESLLAPASGAPRLPDDGHVARHPR